MKRSARVKRRVAIVASHPIQYHAQWYRELALSDELDIEVLYCHRATANDQAQAGFGVDFEWDLPLLEGYRYRFLNNVAAAPGVSDFKGTDTPEIRDIIARERFDAEVVSGWHTKSYWQAIRACLRCGTPVMVRSDSHLHDARPLSTRLLKWLPYRYFIGRMDACLAAGAWSRDYFLHYGAKPERVFIVPHCGTQLVASHTTTDSTRTESRRRWGIAESATAFLFAGKFIARKRPLEFIRALAAAFRAGSDVHGLIVGDGEMRREMQTLADSLGAPITFAGFLNQKEIPEAYIASDILVLPSDQDTWGLVVNEAMAFGRACIVSDRVGCGPDLIVPKQTGFIFPTGDVDALTALLRKVADTAGMARRMGIAAREHIATQSVQVAAANLVLAVRTVMEAA